LFSYRSEDRTLDGYITAKEAAQKWNVSLRSVQAMCVEGRIVGASKMANIWIIPESAEYPGDGRIKSGKYIKSQKDR
jgi:hypothetical protein